MRVVIIGGGMNGATLALALNEVIGPKLNIQIVEAAILGAQEHPGFDARSIAIAQGTAQKLKKFQLWKYFSHCAQPIHKIWVFEEGKCNKIGMTREEYHIDALGYVVPLFEVGQSLYRQIEQVDNITLWSGYQVNEITRSHEAVSVSILKSNENKKLSSEQPKELCADLIVIADGSHSSSVKQLNFAKRIDDYEQSGLIANIKTSKPHKGQAFEMFTEEGPVALLPLTEECMSLVWCASAASILEKMQMSDPCFLADLQKRFGMHLGELNFVGRRSQYELKRHVIERPISHRAVVIGNAAQTLHPIAGQGFNLGMRDISHLCDVLANAVKNMEDIGAYDVLCRYLNTRKDDRSKTLFFTHQLVKWFSNDLLTKRIIRQVGVMAIARSKCLKDKIAYQAMGWFLD